MDNSAQRVQPATLGKVVFGLCDGADYPAAEAGTGIYFNL